jgi:hypothetical protein
MEIVHFESDLTRGLGRYSLPGVILARTVAVGDVTGEGGRTSWW